MPADTDVRSESPIVNGIRQDDDGAFIVPAGEYILGDPCYAVPNERWHELLNSCNCFNESVGTVDGCQVLSFRTAYGDGIYLGTDGAEYGVDAGLIGLVPAALPGLEFSDRFQTRVTFAEPTRCWTDGEDAGMLHFGHVTIDTVQNDDDDVCECCGQRH